MNDIFERYGIRRAVAPSAQAAYEYLLGDPLLHMDMTEALRRGDAELKYADSDGVLMYNKRTGEYLASADNKETAKELMELAEYMPMTAHGKAFSGFGYEYEARQFTYTSIYPPNESAAGITDLELFTALEVANALDVNIQDVREMIADGLGCGAFEEGKLCAFCLLNRDLSLNPAKILTSAKDEKKLYAYAVNAIMRLGFTPFGQVAAKSEAEKRVRECGLFDFSEEPLYIFF